MVDLVTAAVRVLRSRGIDALAHRRWRDPQPGQSVAVVSEGSTHAAMRTTAEAPTLLVQVYSAPTAGQADSEGLALATARRVRRALHAPGGDLIELREAGVLQVLHASTGAPGEPEGRPGWCSVRCVFEVYTG